MTALLVALVWLVVAVPVCIAFGRWLARQNRRTREADARAVAQHRGTVAALTRLRDLEQLPHLPAGLPPEGRR